jgi:hypothetical protein
LRPNLRGLNRKKVPPQKTMGAIINLGAQLRGRYLHPNVAKAGGLQRQVAKGAAVVNLLQTLGNAGSGVLRLSCKVKKMA